MKKTHLYIYYLLKPIIPRFLQIIVRRKASIALLKKHKDIWPIKEKVSIEKINWPGWPDNKKFVLLIAHDVETKIGLDKCIKLQKIDESYSVKSSFNFVPCRYKMNYDIFNYLKSRGYEVGVHGYNHDGRLFFSKRIFDKRAKQINKYLEQWNSHGFYAPSMQHNLEWIQELNIEYSSSTFDVDPFEPQSDGCETIFPFVVKGSHSNYVEIPYTLPQDFTLFVIMQHKNINVWKSKLDWIAEKGGLVHLKVHPDYISFDKKNRFEYPVDRYIEFLVYLKNRYNGQFCSLSPIELSNYIKKICP